MKNLVIVMLLLVSGAAAATEKAHLGMNLTHAKDWVLTRIFADSIKSMRTWKKPNTKFDAAIDSNGWPTEDAEVYIWHGSENNHGTYGLRFEGQATVTAQGGGTVENLVYEKDTGITTGQLVYPRKKGHLVLRFSNTVDGVKNVKLMRPVTTGASEHYPFKTLFTDQILALFDNFSTTRYMNFTGVNGSGHIDWKDRTPMTYATQAHHPCAHDQCSFEGNGSAYEYAILFSNATNTDMWINIPMLATDDYIEQLATLIRRGNPALNLPPLNEKLNVYVELSNEIWNSGKAFYQSKQLAKLSSAYKAAGTLPVLDYDGSTNVFHHAWRYFGLRTTQVSDIFRSVFGDEQMISRIRPILAGQARRLDVNMQALNMIDNMVEGDVSHYIYGGGGSTYYGTGRKNIEPVTLKNIWELNYFDPKVWMVDHQDSNIHLFAAFGLKRVSYEGGPSFDKKNDGYNGVKRIANLDSRIGEEAIEHHKFYREAGGDLDVLFTITGDHQWGFTYDSYMPDTPKMEAVRSISAERDYTFKGGQAIPATLLASNSDVASPKHKRGATKLSEYQWLAYTLRSASNDIYTFTLRIKGSGQASVSISGDEELVDLTDSAQEYQFKAALTIGKNSLRVKAPAESKLTIETIDISVVDL